MTAHDQLISVEEARARMLANVRPLGGETVPLEKAAGRVLAEDLAATRTQPPFDASAMDGYAVRGNDVATAGAHLEVIGLVAAGGMFQGKAEAGQAVRIFTGAPLPEGTDTIVIQENAERAGSMVTIAGAVKPGTYVRKRGLDFNAGDILLHAGTQMHPRHMALAASMNHARLAVRRKPLVAILATGDELVPPGTEPGPGQIVSSNNAGIGAFVESHGGESLQLGIARDDEAALGAAIRRAQNANADILVTLGGASVGDHDLVMRSLEQEGLALDFWRIAMRPGKPLMFGAMGAMRVLGLPGNPVSTIVCAHIFLGPLISAMLGRQEAVRPSEKAMLTKGLSENDERQDYLRARLSLAPDGHLAVTPFDRQDSSMLGVLASSDCLILRPPHAPALGAGGEVEIIRLDPH